MGLEALLIGLAGALVGIVGVLVIYLDQRKRDGRAAARAAFLELVDDGASIRVLTYLPAPYPLRIAAWEQERHVLAQTLSADDFSSLGLAYIRLADLEMFLGTRRLGPQYQRLTDNELAFAKSVEPAIETAIGTVGRYTGWSTETRSRLLRFAQAELSGSAGNSGPDAPTS